MPKHTTPYKAALLASLAAMLTLPTTALAQGAGPVPPADLAKDRENFPEQQDAGVQALTEALSGLHRGNDHSLYINTIDLPDATPALYVEMVTTGEENKPLRQQLWVPHRRDDQLRIRVCELPLGMRDMVVGMWAAPELFPRAGLNQYSPLGDLHVDLDGEHYTASAPVPMPIAHEGAIEYQLQFERTADGFHWEDTGAAINGDEIFRVDAEMKRRPALPVADRREDGTVVIDLRRGLEGPIAEEKDSIALHYSEWSLDGFLLDTSAVQGRAAAYFTIPDTHKYPDAMNTGVIGMRSGGLRRVYTPSANQGLINGRLNPLRARVPLLFEIECISIKDNTP